MQSAVRVLLKRLSRSRQSWAGRPLASIRPSARSGRLGWATPRRLVSQHVGSSHHQLHSQKRLRVARLQSATETKAAPVRSPRAAAWCRAAPRRPLQRQRQASYVSRGSGALALLQAARRGHAPQRGPIRPITRGVRRGGAALRATGAVAVRRTRQGVSGLPMGLQGGAAWLRTSATCRQRQQAAPQRPCRRPANAATAAAPLTPPCDAAAARPWRCRRRRRRRRRGFRQWP